MKFHTLFFSKIRKDVNLSSAAVVIGALRVKQVKEQMVFVVNSRENG